jgi:raffinose/stachyose/melibiose transport system permease protein
VARHPYARLAGPCAGREGPVGAAPPPGPPRRVAYLYIAPAFIVYALFLLYPVGRSVVLSLYEWDGLTAGTWAGLANYTDIFTDDRLRSSFLHTGVLVIFFAIIPTTVGLVLAAVVARARVRGLSFFRVVIFLPQVVAMVVVAVTWRQIYAPDGTLNELLRLVGLDGLTRGWLGDFTFALPAVGVVGTWVSTGLCFVLLLAGTGKIPSDLYDAVRVDGGGAIREFFTVTLPALRNELVVALTLTVIAALRTFDLVYVTTRGGPGTSTTVPSYEVYRRAFEIGQVGSAAAIGVTLTVIILGINLLIARIGARS